MSHNNQPEYYTINSIDPHDGSVTCLGIFENMDAVMYRLKRCYTTCGDEYRIECHHLSTAEAEAEACSEQLVSRLKYQHDEAEKEKKLKEYDEWKGQIKQDAQLPDIKAQYQTVEGTAA